MTWGRVQIQIIYYFEVVFIGEKLSNGDYFERICIFHQLMSRINLQFFWTVKAVLKIGCCLHRNTQYPIESEPDGRVCRAAFKDMVFLFFSAFSSRSISQCNKIKHTMGALYATSKCMLCLFL